MKTISTTAGTLLAALCVTCAAGAEEKNVTVTLKVERKVKPDAAFVTLYVKADALTMVDAAKEADQKVEEVPLHFF